MFRQVIRRAQTLAEVSHSLFSPSAQRRPLINLIWTRHSCTSELFPPRPPSKSPRPSKGIQYTPYSIYSVSCRAVLQSGNASQMQSACHDDANLSAEWPQPLDSCGHFPDDSWHWRLGLLIGIHIEIEIRQRNVIWYVWGRRPWTLTECLYIAHTPRHPRLPLNPNSKPVQILTHQTQLQLIF